MSEANVCSYQAMREDPDLDLVKKDVPSNKKHVDLSTLPQPFSSMSSYFIDLSG